MTSSDVVFTLSPYRPLHRRARRPRQERRYLPLLRHPRLPQVHRGRPCRQVGQSHLYSQSSFSKWGNLSLIKGLADLYTTSRLPPQFSTHFHLSPFSSIKGGDFSSNEDQQFGLYKKTRVQERGDLYLTPQAASGRAQRHGRGHHAGSLPLL